VAPAPDAGGVNVAGALSWVRVVRSNFSKRGGLRGLLSEAENGSGSSAASDCADARAQGIVPATASIAIAHSETPLALRRDPTGPFLLDHTAPKPDANGAARAPFSGAPAAYGFG